MLKFGFELEAFCLKDDKPVLVPKQLPMDECGWLVEVRSSPHEGVTEALYLLQAAKRTVERDAVTAEVALLYEPLYEIPRDLKVQAARRSGKGQIHYRNLYGHETHRCSTKLATAALHVSVTNFHEGQYAGAKGDIIRRTELRFVDHAALIVRLDEEFKEEIRAAKRNPGFYEVKADGRVEYRSLPNNVDLDKLDSVLRDLKEDLTC